MSNERLRVNMTTAIREFPKIAAAALYQEALKIQKASMKRTRPNVVS